MISEIEQFLTGDIGMDAFLAQLKADPVLQRCICKFIPEDARNDPAHSYWKIVPYETIRQNNFNYYQFLFWAQTDNKFGNQLSIFSRLQRAYLYYHPDFVCTSRYEDAFDTYLDAIQYCFDGPEVQHVVERIIDESLQLRFKTQRKKYAQSAIKEQFHLENRKRPRWVQGPEWPMGKNSPMAFVSQRGFGEQVQFVFRDVDTEEIRTIEQFY